MNDVINLSLLSSVFVTLFVIMDPPGTVPVFISLTAGQSRAVRKKAAWQAVLVAFGVIVVFAAFGQQILHHLGITLPALQAAGGLLLLLIALQLLTDTAEDPVQTKNVNIAFVPLGTPLLAGPGAIVATMVFVQRADGSLPDVVAISLGIIADPPGDVADAAVLRRDHADPRGERRAPGHPDRRSAAECDRRTAGRGRGDRLHQGGLMDDMLPGMPTRLFVATPTKLLTFADCKRKYRYTYLETPRPPKGPPWAHNTVGAIVHEVLADFFGRWPAARRTPDEVVAKMRSSWRSEGFRDEDSRWTGGIGRPSMVLGYLRDSDPYYEPRGVERTVAFTTERASLRGRVDRIDERPARDGSGGTELAIVDYKTGRRPLTSTDARSSLAMALYVLGARRVLHKPCTRVELHHLPTNTVAAADHDDASLARHQRRAESIARRRGRRRGPLARRSDPGRSRRGVPAGAVAAVRLVRLRPHLPRRPPRRPTPRPLGRSGRQLAHPAGGRRADRSCQRCVRGVPAEGWKLKATERGVA